MLAPPRVPRSVRASLVIALGALGCGGPAPSPDAALADDASALDAYTDDAGHDADRLDAPRADVQLPVPSGEPLSWSVTEAGPFGVGYRSWPLSYVPAGQTESRDISVHVWYPTLSVEGEHPRYEGLFRDEVALVDVPAAAPAHAEGYPLFVHSHGWRGFPGASWPMLDRLASHGWVVVMPEHVGSTLTRFEDPRPVAHYYERSLDVTEAVDALAALPVSDPLSRTATERFVLGGHSFGVHTVWASVGAHFDVEQIRAGCWADGRCTEAELSVFAAGVTDSRIVAALPIAGAIDPAFFGERGHDSVRVPMLSVTGSADTVDGRAQQTRVSPPVPLDWVEVEGACHNSFAVPTLACATLEAASADHLTATLALAFARVHVLGDVDPVSRGIVEGATSLPGTTFQAHTAGAPPVEP